MKNISIIIPVYNEISTLEQILKRINEVSFANLHKEIIVGDDFSTDGSRELLEKLQKNKNENENFKVLFHEKNQGKGAAIRTAIKNANGDIIVIQDADLEYDPIDYEPLVKLIIEDKADVAYGSRFLNSNHKFMITQLIGNKTLTFITNILFKTKLTDMETCYKAFRANFIKDINIKSNRFDFEPEITAKVLKRGARLIELPISYNGREYDDGKKITWKDGVHAIFALIKFKFSN